MIRGLLTWLALAPLIAAQAPASKQAPAASARQTRIDTWTYILSLERERAAQSLDDYLTAYGKLQYGIDIRSTEPLKTATRDDDEGACYFLDLAAEVCTRGAINFSRAKHLNENLGKLLPVQTKKSGSPTGTFERPLPNRAAFYLENMTAVSADSNNPEKGAWETVCRRYDIAQVAWRMEVRDRYLAKVTGEQPKDPVATTQDPAWARRWQQMLTKHAEERQDNTEERRTYEVAKSLWARHENGEPINYQMLSDMAKRSAEARAKARVVESDEDNYLRLWMGYAALKLGDDHGGMDYLQAFFAGAASFDAEHELKARQRRRILSALIEARKERVDNVLVAVSALASVASFAIAIDGIAKTVNVIGYSGSLEGYNQALVAANSALAKSGHISVLMGLSNQSLTSVLAMFNDGASYQRRTELLSEIPIFYLQIARYINKLEQLEIYTLLAETYYRDNQPRAAIEYFKKAIQIAEIHRGQFLRSEDRARYLSLRSRSYEKIIEALVDARDYDDAITYSEKARARIFLDLIDNFDDVKSTGSDGFMKERKLRATEMSELLDQKQISAQQVYSSTGQRGGGALNRAPTAVELNLVGQGKLATVKEVVASLPANTGIVSFFSTANASFRFCLSGRGIKVRRLPADAAEIKRLVVAARRELHEQPQPKSSSSSALSTLSQMLLEELLSDLPGVDNLVVVPHQSLNDIPFQALVMNEEYLLKRYTITSAPSVSIYQRLQERQAHTSDSFLLVGNPLLNYAKGYKSLPRAEEEVRILSTMLPKPMLLTGMEATETAFKKRAELAGLIHIAAHGWYDVDNPTKSALLLAKDDTNDGIVDLADIYRLRLRAQMVVMSACSSGRSERSTGDDLQGLVRAFLYAGANTTISSLWEVDDEATELLMRKFYARMIGEQGRQPEQLAVALRNAQIEMLSERPDPYNWSAFVLVGDGGRHVLGSPRGQ